MKDDNSEGNLDCDDTSLLLSAPFCAPTSPSPLSISPFTSSTKSNSHKTTSIKSETKPILKGKNKHTLQDVYAEEAKRMRH